MLYLTCTIISSVGHLAHYRVFHAKDRVSADCGTIRFVEGFDETKFK